MDTNILKKLEGLTEEERKVTLDILKQYKQEGKSSIYTSLVYQDYKEIPVDIETFLTDDRYLGIPSKDADGKSKVYPFWMKKLKILFPDNINTSVNTFIASGARGLGKSETCVNYIMCYELYRDMCLKDALQYYHLKKTDKIVYALMNIKKELAEEIAIDKFQNTVKQSPWFMERGVITGRTTKLWAPKPEYNIDIKIGSQADDLIGLPVKFCLDGETDILTPQGIFKIKDLVNKDINVLSISDDHNVIVSNICSVKPTKKTDDEYQITLEDDTIIKCTPDHSFMLTTGEYKEAQYLTADDELLDFIPYGYIYKTTNLINGKIYIGQHKKTYLDENYLGSGFSLSRAIKKYGKNNFTCQILEFCKDKKDLDIKEIKYIRLFNSTDPSKGYNISSGGQGGDLGPVVNYKISQKLKGRPKSEEQKKLLSERNKGHKNSPEVRRKISQANKGKKLSQEVKDKISKANSGKKRQKPNIDKGKIMITDGIVVKHIFPDQELPIGWHRGCPKMHKKHDMTNYYSNIDMQIKNKQNHSGCHNSMFGKGYKILGELNGKAVKRYFYLNLIFECRKDLVKYLQENGFPDISSNIIRAIENKTYKSRTYNKFKYVIENLTWRYKDENKENRES